MARQLIAKELLCCPVCIHRHGAGDKVVPHASEHLHQASPAAVGQFVVQPVEVVRVGHPNLTLPHVPPVDRSQHRDVRAHQCKMRVDELSCVLASGGELHDRHHAISRANDVPHSFIRIVAVKDRSVRVRCQALYIVHVVDLGSVFNDGAARFDFECGVRVQGDRFLS